MRAVAKVAVVAALVIWAIVCLIGIVAALTGCTQQPTEGEPWLTYEVKGLIVIFRVHGPQASQYLWDFGDGQTATTTTAEVAHTYAQAGVYVVKVEGLGPGWAGQGEPGPGNPLKPVVLFSLNRTVDLRPALEIVGMRITVVDPPYWYTPGAWPEWHYPAACLLRFEPLVRVNRPGEVGIVQVIWYVFDNYQRLVGSGTGQEWIWVEAGERFLARGCPPVKAPYRVFMAVKLTTGEIVEEKQEICACPSGGC